MGAALMEVEEELSVDEVFCLFPLDFIFSRKGSFYFFDVGLGFCYLKKKERKRR